MPERSFGRTIRFRRTKLGLSQSKLGELVGRSPSTVRSWERDDSTPNDPEVLMALSAVLGVEQRTLFEKAGMNRPEMETSPTLEQELATLRPAPGQGGEDPDDDGIQISLTYEELSGLTDEDAEDRSHQEEPEVPVAAFVEPPSPSSAESGPGFVVTPIDQGNVGPSYMEDPNDRQLYRVRNVGTAVGVVVMLLLLMYAAGKGIEAFGDWWDSFFGQLRL